MGCTPSTQLHEDDYSVGDSSSDDAARRASGIEREATLDDSALRRPPMIRVDSLTSVRTDT